MGKPTHMARAWAVAAALVAAVLVLGACSAPTPSGVQPADVTFTSTLPADIRLGAVRGASGLPDGMLLSRALALGLPVVLVPFSEACAACLTQLRVADELAPAYAGLVRVLGLHVPHTYGDQPPSNTVLGTTLPLVRVDVVEARAYGFDQPGASVHLFTTTGRSAREPGLYSLSALEALVEALLAAE
jgi:hypothetical protein